ncbi:MAG: hypothetical protein IT200_07510 [Thermoleophilia bacterium]|nr:hypothetical protein [Thermoleophilia bacterium]
MTDRDLELALGALGARLRQEENPDLTAAVTARIAGTPAHRRRPRRGVLLGVALASAVAAGGAFAASPGLRDEVRSWLSGAGVDVRTTATAPLPAPPRTVAELGLGQSVTAGRARRATGVVVPAGGVLGPPSTVLLASGPRPAVSFVWPPSAAAPAVPGTAGVGAVLTVTRPRGPGDPFVLAKSLPAGVTVEFVHIPGAPEQGVWIAGAPHAVTTLEGRTERFRLAANALLWKADGWLYRLELAAGSGGAVAIAAGLRPGG